MYFGDVTLSTFVSKSLSLDIIEGLGVSVLGKYLH